MLCSALGRYSTSTFTSVCLQLLSKNENSLRQNILKRHAGHSKWANIRHIKAAKDAEKSAVFSRIAYQIRATIKETGNADPKTNPKLAQIVELGRSSNMPVDKINDCIKKALGSKDDSKQHILEVKAGNVQILVEVLTSRFTHVKNGINTVLKKHGAKNAENGYCLRNFSLKGIILARAPPQQTYEKALEDAIESGAEEVSEEEDDEGKKEFKFFTNPNDFTTVKTELITRGYVITNGSVEYIPRDLVKLNDEEMQTLSVLVQKLQQCDDVNKVYDNVE